MYKKLFYILCFFSTYIGIAQDCPGLTNPLQGATNVPVETPISWENVVGVTGYIISIGTTPGGTEIINEQAIGTAITFSPPLGLPEATTIYVTITLFFFDQDNIVCPSQFFTTEDVTTVPDCTSLENPQDGDTNINVGVSLVWEYAAKALGYRITLGTLPGVGDILSNFDVGNTLSFNPAADFPAGTTIFVKVVPYNENGMAINCTEESFTTGTLGEPPGCTYLITPENGAINVSLSPFIEWAPAQNALGYIVNIGKTPYTNEVLDGAIFYTTSTYVLNFESNNTYFVRIIPFNTAGQAKFCGQESFSTILGCGPFYDPDTGELISYYPESDFPDTVGICDNNLPTTIQSPDVADGYRWYQLLDTGAEELISEERFAAISETGNYRYEVFNIIPDGDQPIECLFTKEFTVTVSSIASIEDIFIAKLEELYNVTVEISGLGDYEYSFDGLEFTENNFKVYPLVGNHTITVRDRNGCGEVTQTFVIKSPPTGFPPYFSPNGDGINDYWQYVPPKVNALPIKLIYVYNRYGKLLATVGRLTRGWDGTYNSNPMPADGYWYKAIATDGKVYTGNFSLVR
ncbi:MAG: T9SS type B sorting domain-containing protein [Flavobacteriaceae bacterium]